MAPKPKTSTRALSPMAPRARSDGCGPRSPLGGSAGAVNQTPGRPAICTPVCRPFPPAAVIRLEESLPIAAARMHLQAAIQRLRKKLGPSRKNARACSAVCPLPSPASSRDSRAAVDAGVRPCRSSPARRPSRAMTIKSISRVRAPRRQSAKGPLSHLA